MIVYVLTYKGNIVNIFQTHNKDELENHISKIEPEALQIRCAYFNVKSDGYVGNWYVTFKDKVGKSYFLRRYRLVEIPNFLN